MTLGTFIILLLSLACLIKSIHEFLRVRTILRNGIKTTAKIIDFDEIRNETYPIIEFEDEKNQSYIVHFPNSTGISLNITEIDIIYDKNNPENVLALEDWSYFVVIIAFLMFLLFLYMTPYRHFLPKIFWE